MHDIKVSNEILEKLGGKLLIEVQQDGDRSVISLGLHNETPVVKKKAPGKSKPRKKKEVQPKEPLIKKEMRLGVAIENPYYSEMTLSEVEYYCEWVANRMGVTGVRALVLHDTTGELAMAASTKNGSVVFHSELNGVPCPNDNLRPVAVAYLHQLATMEPQDLDMIIATKQVGWKLLANVCNKHLADKGYLLFVDQNNEEGNELGHVELPLSSDQSVGILFNSVKGVKLYECARNRDESMLEDADAISTV